MKLVRTIFMAMQMRKHFGKKLQDHLKLADPKQKRNEWLFNATSAPAGLPADLGYFIGAKICESYYNQASDKQQAIKDLLTLDPDKADEFLTKSKYADKFK